MRKRVISKGYTDFRIMGCYRHEKCGEKNILHGTANPNTVSDCNSMINPPAQPCFMKNGECNSTGIQPLANYLSTDSKIYQNYINRFIKTTEITSFLKSMIHAKMAADSCFGKEIQVLIHAVQPGGEYPVAFNSSGMAAGIYFYSLTTLEERELRMMLRVKY